MNLKVFAHESGHYLRQIRNDYFNPNNFAVLGLIDNASYITRVGAGKAYRAIKNRKSISRREFLTQAGLFTGISSGFLGANYLIQQQASYYEEKDADYKSDAIVPEFTMEQAFSEMRQMYKDHKDDPDAKIRRSSSISHILSRFFGNHPPLETRYTESKHNCEKFAKNTLLWTPQ